MADDWLSLSGKQRKEWTNKVVSTYGRICYRCGLPIKADQKVTLDHVKPRSKGGKTTLENCRPAHSRCNSSAGARETGGIETTVHNGLGFFLSQSP